MHETDAGPDRSRPGRVEPVTTEHATGHRYDVDEDEPLDVAIAYAIGVVEGVDPQDVEPPLHDAVDPEALERIFESATGDTRARFVVGAYDVTVEDGGDAVVVDTN